MKPIYNKKGEITDYSDEGAFKEDLENRIDVYYFLKRLPARQRKVIDLRMKKYTYREIQDKLHISSKTIRKYLLETGKQIGDRFI